MSSFFTICVNLSLFDHCLHLWDILCVHVLANLGILANVEIGIFRKMWSILQEYRLCLSYTRIKYRCMYRPIHAMYSMTHSFGVGDWMWASPSTR